MKEVSASQSFDFFIDTLHHLDERHLTSDSDLEYFILEELSSDAYSFLHSITIDKLISNELIPYSIKQDVQCLRDLVIELLENKRELQSIRNDPEWIRARCLSKSIIDTIEGKRE
jgi:hypothetical protein